MAPVSARVQRTIRASEALKACAVRAYIELIGEAERLRKTDRIARGTGSAQELVQSAIIVALPSLLLAVAPDLSQAGLTVATKVSVDQAALIAKKAWDMHAPNVMTLAALDQTKFERMCLEAVWHVWKAPRDAANNVLLLLTGVLAAGAYVLYMYQGIPLSWAVLLVCMLAAAAVYTLTTMPGERKAPKSGKVPSIGCNPPDGSSADERLKQIVSAVCNPDLRTQKRLTSLYDRLQGDELGQATAKAGRRAAAAAAATAPPAAALRAVAQPGPGTPDGRDSPLAPQEESEPAGEEEENAVKPGAAVAAAEAAAAAAAAATASTVAMAAGAAPGATQTGADATLSTPVAAAATDATISVSSQEVPSTTDKASVAGRAAAAEAALAMEASALEGKAEQGAKGAVEEAARLVVAAAAAPTAAALGALEVPAGGATGTAAAKAPGAAAAAPVTTAPQPVAEAVAGELLLQAMNAAAETEERKPEVVTGSGGDAGVARDVETAVQRTREDAAAAQTAEAGLLAKGTAAEPKGHIGASGADAAASVVAVLPPKSADAAAVKTDGAGAASDKAGASASKPTTTTAAMAARRSAAAPKAKPASPGLFGCFGSAARRRA